METDIGQWALGLLLLTSADHILSSTILAEENKGQSTAPPTCELSATKDRYGPILASKECHHGTP